MSSFVKVSLISTASAGDIIHERFELFGYLHGGSIASTQYGKHNTPLVELNVPGDLIPQEDKLAGMGDQTVSLPKPLQTH